MLLKKEEIQEALLKNQVAIVFDILLATSTISSMFYHGAKEIVPVLDKDEALRKAEELSADDAMLVGEYLGQTIDGFFAPIPSLLKDKVKDKRIIFSTTNGTVALKNCKAADEVYAASMLNETALANYLIERYGASNYLLVCSGSSDAFNLEDLYGAGSFIAQLIERGREKNLQWLMTDSALAAFYFYKGNEQNGEKLLKLSRVGQSLVQVGLGDEVTYILQKNACPVIPKLKGEALTVVK